MLVFATSFHEAMYAVSGRDLLRSWLRHCPEGRMVVYAEGADVGFVGEARDDRVAVERLDDDPWLRGWLEANRAHIPAELGGGFRGKMSMWDRKSSLWARKAAALLAAYDGADEGDLVAWVDADVLFTADVPAGTFEGSDVAYACSPSRKRRTGIETGVLLLRKCAATAEAVGLFRRRYDEMALAWDDLPRHDDGYVLLAVLREMTAPGEDFLQDRHRLTSGARCRDVALADTAEPLARSPFAPYLVHQKGLHASTGADGMHSPGEAAKRGDKARAAAYRAERRRVRRAL